MQGGETGRKSRQLVMPVFYNRTLCLRIWLDAAKRLDNDHIYPGFVYPEFEWGVSY
jgi:hypothetical protein